MTGPAEGGVIDAPPWFRVLRDSTLVFSAVCRVDGTLLDANRLAVEGCGFSREQVLSRPLWKGGWWSRDRHVADRIRAWCAEVAAGGEPVRAVTPYFLADGTQRTADFALQLVREDDGTTYLVPTGMDITDRLDAERAAAIAWSERVLATVADGLYGIDAEGRVEFVNASAVRLTGYSEEQQLHLDQHDLLHYKRPDGSPYPREECPVYTALETGRPVTADSEVYWRADGTALPVELTAAPTIENGAVTGVVVSFRDITERLAARCQAEELQRLAVREEAQRALSDRLQQALLTPPPQPDHLQIAVRYRPAANGAQVGGDWYDAFLQPDGATVLAIGDVVGHDSGAAAAMGQLRGLVRALAYDNDETPSATLTRADRTADGLAVSTLATAVLARIERRGDGDAQAGRVLRWSNAGHPPPVLLHPDGTCAVLTTPPDLMLGVHPDARRRDHAVDLPDESTLVLVTDGLLERRGSDLDEGMDRLVADLTDLSGEPLESLLDAVLARLVPEPGHDDVAIIAVRTLPAGLPPRGD